MLCNLDQVQYLVKPPPKPPKAPKARTHVSLEPHTDRSLSHDPTNHITHAQLSPVPSRRSSRRSLGVGSSPGSVLVVQEDEAGSEEAGEADEEAASASAAASSAAGGDDDAGDEEEETEPGASDAKVKAEARSVDGEEEGRVMGGRPCVVFLDSLDAHRSEKIHTFLIK